jgi:mannose-6-phosphate isomerase-like protein (cupin superfamily)
MAQQIFANNPSPTMSGHTYPRTIDNGAGERLTFIRRAPGPAGDRLEVENVVQPGAGPPMHVHHHQEEAMTVQEGRVAYQRPGEAARFAGPGETVVFKPGEPHRFWNAGEVTLRLTGHIEPADNVEYVLTELYASMKQRGGSGPDPFDAAFLIQRYRSEMAMLDIPNAVQRVVFPAQVALGKLLGKYRKYAGAPEPVRR